jgi:DnaJ-class molecular chaperone
VFGYVLNHHTINTRIFAIPSGRTAFHIANLKTRSRAAYESLYKAFPMSQKNSNQTVPAAIMHYCSLCRGSGFKRLKCTDCRGTGYRTRVCRFCDGKGKILASKYGDGVDPVEKTCMVCAATSGVARLVCHSCDGLRTMETKTPCPNLLKESG